MCRDSFFFTSVSLPCSFLPLLLSWTAPNFPLFVLYSWSPPNFPLFVFCSWITPGFFTKSKVGVNLEAKCVISMVEKFAERSSSGSQSLLSDSSRHASACSDMDRVLYGSETDGTYLLHTWVNLDLTSTLLKTKESDRSNSADYMRVWIAQRVLHSWFEIMKKRKSHHSHQK
jgi:hypothetical protein